MAFPISPTIGQEYTIGTHTYEWNGTAWDIAGSTTASAIGIRLMVDGVDNISRNYNAISSHRQYTAQGIVPAGSTYQMNWINASTTISLWFELR